MATNPAPQSQTTAIADLDVQTSLRPIGDLAVPGGYVVTGLNMSDRPEEQAAIAQIASKVLENPLLMQKLSDRVYQLMLEDLRHQRERRINYGGSL